MIDLGETHKQAKWDTQRDSFEDGTTSKIPLTSQETRGNETKLGSMLLSRKENTGTNIYTQEKIMARKVWEIGKSLECIIQEQNIFKMEEAFEGSRVKGKWGEDKAEVVVVNVYALCELSRKKSFASMQNCFTCI
ncbi:hypothetical protein VNO77_22778 [Canavalia gladiata]|uniref:Uncharacterized protein n=1 Tax=Canavalia gladiata TaxID=3824 RepID=A0AAN9L3Q6_CANGL